MTSQATKASAENSITLDLVNPKMVQALKNQNKTNSFLSNYDKICISFNVLYNITTKFKKKQVQIFFLINFKFLVTIFSYNLQPKPNSP